jgi:hypothetical protein
LGEQKFGLATRRAYIRDVGIVFNYAVKRGYCAVTPVANIERPVLEDDAPEIFAVDQASALLTAAETNPGLELVPTIAIGLFAGLPDGRTAEAGMEGRGFRGEGHRGGRTEVEDAAAPFCGRFGQPRDLAPPVPQCQGLGRAELVRGRLGKLRKKADMTTGPKNGMRHSFVSYHVAQHQNPNMTPLRAGHDVDVSFSNYRNLVKPKEAVR